MKGKRGAVSLCTPVGALGQGVLPVTYILASGGTLLGPRAVVEIITYHRFGCNIVRSERFVAFYDEKQQRKSNCGNCSPFQRQACISLVLELN